MPKEKKEKPEILTMEDVKKLPVNERMKYEIADEIGVVDKVFAAGWRSLSAKESGRIGGLLANRMKKNREQ